MQSKFVDALSLGRTRAGRRRPAGRGRGRSWMGRTAGLASVVPGMSRWIGHERMPSSGCAFASTTGFTSCVWRGMTRTA